MEAPPQTLETPGAPAPDRDDPLDHLLALAYEELRRIAHHHLHRESPGHTLSTTALVHEAYLRLADQKRARWIDRTQFLAIASTTMRRVLVDHARRHRTVKRGGNLRVVSLDDATLLAEQRADALVALDEALTRLGAMEERLGRVVECRFFGGLTEDETASVLGVTARTVRRDWVKARGWLYNEIREDTP